MYICTTLQFGHPLTPPWTTSRARMSGRGDYHGVRSGEKRKAEIDEATLGVAPKLPKTKTEKDTYASPPVRPGVDTHKKWNYCLRSR